MNKLETLKKKLLYRSNYRGTKEMDILLSNFVKKYINIFDEEELKDLDKFLNMEDESIYDFYHKDEFNKNFNDNKISKYFKKFRI